MILIYLIGILFVGGIIAWLSERLDSRYPRVIALVTILIDLVFMASLVQMDPSAGGWIASIEAPWIPRFGISFLS